MTTNKFKYTNPVDMGFKKIKLTSKQHKEIFKTYYNDRSWRTHVEYYMNDSCVYVHTFSSWILILLAILLFPASCFMCGVIDAWNETKRLFSQKKSGNYNNHIYYNTSDVYKSIINIKG